MVKIWIRKSILAVMAIMCMLTLCFDIIGYYGFNYYYHYVQHVSENGFDMLSFNSKLGYSWTGPLLGGFSILEILLAIAAIVFAGVNMKTERTAWKVLVFVFSMVISGLYMLTGIIFVSICIANGGSGYYTAAFVPFIIQLTLLIGYCIINKVIPEDSSSRAKTVPNAGYNPYAQPQYNNPNAGYNPYAQQPSPQAPQFVQPQSSIDGVVYDLKGVRGRNMKVYEDKCIIKTDVTFGSILTGNASDGEKTIYYSDVLGVQFKLAKMQIGYLQLETASSSMNNKGSNFFNENSFTYDPSLVQETTNELMQQVADYIRSRVEFYKKQKNGGTTVAALSQAEELKKFKELLDMGVITQEEFDAKKKALLGL